MIDVLHGIPTLFIVAWLHMTTSCYSLVLKDRGCIPREGLIEPNDVAVCAEDAEWIIEWICYIYGPLFQSYQIDIHSIFV